ncbi:MAG: Uma2 family endonuclease [Roseofilum sp. SBFL]|uniref:Uma2 family endonuclease n=1 Tax=unclassified Roseofilum TaxID=2620099 RepID=UPI001AFD9024|nr:MULTISPECIES: Uma2 family endonuclease [unclassified Roseofilum]MBP0012204.1 Uma2 family endonuclease [Roseofilum sp. SID3]MBP0024797.1 Uma2 family endonuclease [Roseofilum sp. SID2]MBP0039004.1 Uma2 family endonuclease [Roseofilum sp. SID1]MBP0043651.1 Uma2 family endonuclease [Roseofilum sp. SBFL]
MTTFILNNPESASITEEQFYQLCAANRDLKLERTARGDLVIMPPTGGETGRRNSDINVELNLWNRQSQLGIVFDSSTCFHLADGSDRSPDASWIPLAQWEALSAEQKDKFPPLCPDFVIELRSPSDSLTLLQNKMLEYMDNGTRLGWLINPKNCQVEIYRQGQEKETLDNPTTLSGEDVLPGFSLNFNLIW